MKAIVIRKNYPWEAGGTIGWCFVADSALSNVGKPFYLPGALGIVDAHLTVAIRFSRLGKGISSRFASRYYQEMAPAVHFRLPEYGKTLLEEALPDDASFNFDRSLMVGEFIPFDILDRFELWKNGERVAEFDFSELRVGIDKCIEVVSLFNTIKMGDLMMPALCEGVEIEEGDTLEVKKDGDRCFVVKVK